MRQENIFLEKPDAPYNLLKCVIENSFIVGPNKKLKLNYGVTSFMVDAPVNREYVNGEPLNVYIPKDKTIILPWAGRY